MPLKSVMLEELSWASTAEYLRTESIVIVPVGSIEQHGPHLPLGTDTINVTFLACRAAEQTQVLVAPTIKTGVSFNHIDFPGTLSLQPETLVALVVDVVTSLIHHGFDKVIVLNGHGGNNAALETATIKLRLKFTDQIIGLLHSWLLIKDSPKLLQSPIRYHADEGETSRMLISAPELVDMTEAKSEIPHSKSGLFNFQITEVFKQVVFYGLPRTKSVTQSGIFGDAHLANREKGQAMFDEAIRNFVNEINRLKRVNLADYNEG